MEAPGRSHGTIATILARTAARDTSLLALLAAGGLLARAARLADAVDRFDRATIMTTHEFCHGMLRGLGVLAPQEPQSALIEDVRGLADEAAADVYLRRYAFDERFPPFGFADGREGDDPGARSIARDAVEVQAEIGPTDADGVVADIGRLGALLGAIKIEHQGAQNHGFDWTTLQLRYARAFGEPWPVEAQPAAQT